jgi:hypothetical protein
VLYYEGPEFVTRKEGRWVEYVEYQVEYPAKLPSREPRQSHRSRRQRKMRRRILRADASVSLADDAFFGPLRETGTMTQWQRRSAQLVFRAGGRGIGPEEAGCLRYWIDWIDLGTIVPRHHPSSRHQPTISYPTTRLLKAHPLHHSSESLQLADVFGAYTYPQPT